MVHAVLQTAGACHMHGGLKCCILSVCTYMLSSMQWISAIDSSALINNANINRPIPRTLCSYFWSLFNSSSHM